MSNVYFHDLPVPQARKETTADIAQRVDTALGRCRFPAIHSADPKTRAPIGVTIMDHVRPEVRSRIMARVHGSDTKPELVVRRLAHRLGYRYRLHVADLSGRPDLVFRSRRKVIFVHGCFWHQHDCKRGTRPKDNQEFWSAKLERNRARDAEVTRSLNASGWEVLVVWECQTRDETKLAKRLVRFLG